MKFPNKTQCCYCCTERNTKNNQSKIASLFELYDYMPIWGSKQQLFTWWRMREGSYLIISSIDIRRTGSLLFGIWPHVFSVSKKTEDKYYRRWQTLSANTFVTCNVECNPFWKKKTSSTIFRWNLSVSKTDRKNKTNHLPLSGQLPLS